MMMQLRLDPFLAAADAERIYNVLRTLTASGLDYAVTGGIALEAALGPEFGRQRPFNDIDVVAAGFEVLPPALASTFMISHAHPHRAAGKLAIQLVEPEQRVRIDVFSACGSTLDRVRPALIGDLPINLIALEDMACRIVLEMMSFSRGDAVPPKCADDHARAGQLVDASLVERAWQDQRGAIDPPTYAEATIRIAEALERRVGRFAKQTYSTDADTICRHCRDVADFKITPPRSILSILGYC